MYCYLFHFVQNLMSFYSLLSQCVWLTYLLLFLLQDSQESLTSQYGNKPSFKKRGDGNSDNSGNAQPAVPSSFNSSQLLAQRKLFAESQIGRTSFQRLLESSSSHTPGLAPYRVVLGDVKEKVLPLVLNF